MYVARRFSPASSSPSTRTRPDEGGSRPATMFSNVDLPQPLGPTITTNAPEPTLREMSCRVQYVLPSGAVNARVTRSSSSIDQLCCEAGDRVGGRILAVRAVARRRQHREACRGGA